MKSEMTIGKKLAICFGITGILSAATGLCAWIYVAKLKNEIANIVNITAKKVEIVSDIKNPS